MRCDVQETHFGGLFQITLAKILSSRHPDCLRKGLIPWLGQPQAVSSGRLEDAAIQYDERTTQSSNDQLLPSPDATQASTCRHPEGEPPAGSASGLSATLVCRRTLSQCRRRCRSHRCSM